MPAEPSSPRYPARVVVLCDAAAATGLGHFVRCTALAGRLAAGGAQVLFLLDEDALPQAGDRVLAAGWELAMGPWDHDTVRASTGPGTVVVVDSYRVDGAWLTELHRTVSATGALLAVVDDQADRPFTADLVLNQNLGAERLRYAGAGRVLAGPEYALLRPEFPRAREAALATVDDLPDRPRRVLVLFGGTDASGMARTAALAAHRAFPDAEVRAVVPVSGPGAEPPGITLLRPMEAIHEEMLAADLVVSAGGTTLWELCCLARPTAVVAVAGNQQPAYDEMSADGAILPAGREPVYDPDLLARRLRDVVRPGSLRAVARQAARITDGRGCERVAEVLGALGADLAARREETSVTDSASPAVRVRPATAEDGDLLLGWRNDPEVREVSRSSEEIDPDQHRAWLTRTLADPDRHLLVVERAVDGSPVATTRYDLLRSDGDRPAERSRWEVSITVAPGLRGQGLGGVTLRSSDEWLRTAEPQATEIEAWVLPANAGSRRLFERNGYRAAASEGQEMDCYVRRWERRPGA